MNAAIVRDFAKAAYRKGLHQLSRFGRDGRNIFEEEWDLLIVIDACRLDLFREAIDRRPIEPAVGSRWSVDSMTREWMSKTFVEDFAGEQSQTRYICGNPFSSEAVDEGRLAALDEVWRHQWDSEHGTLLPRPLTDRAIDHGRSEDQKTERVIVHYMQPHWPFLDALELSDGRGWDISGFADNGDSDYRAWDNNPDDVWERLRLGEIDRDGAWRAYRENLHRVLDDVAVLLKNYDAERAVITSDHGNALGEWGIYGHPMHMPLRCLREVPWAETTAIDERTHEPDPANLKTKEIDEEVGQKLTRLGYLK